MSDSENVVGIVILNYNSAEDAINCVRSVEQYNTAKVKYIVVDNASTKQGSVETMDEAFSSMFGLDYQKRQESVSYEKQELPHITLLTSAHNDGYARGNNKGIKLADTDDTLSHILILNSDVLFVDDIIPSLIDYLNKLPNAAIMSPMLYKKEMKGYDYTCARRIHTNNYIICSYLLMKSSIFGILKRMDLKRLMLKSDPSISEKEYIEIELPSGSCMLFSKGLTRKIKLFDPNTFLYYEENIIYKQEEKLNLKNYLVPRLKCIHLGATSTRKSSKTFVLNEGLKSADYYLNTYCDMTIFQRILFLIAKNIYKIKLFFIKKLKE